MRRDGESIDMTSTAGQLTPGRQRQATLSGQTRGGSPHMRSHQPQQHSPPQKQSPPGPHRRSHHTTSKTGHNTNPPGVPAGAKTHSALRTRNTHDVYGNEKRRGTQSTSPFQNAMTRNNTRPHSGSRAVVSEQSYSCGSRRRCLRQASRGSDQSSNGARHQTLHLSERDIHGSTPTRAGLKNRP